MEDASAGLLSSETAVFWLQWISTRFRRTSRTMGPSPKGKGDAVLSSGVASMLATEAESKALTKRIEERENFLFIFAASTLIRREESGLERRKVLKFYCIRLTEIFIPLLFKPER